jgi:hypothetical protein
MRAVTNTLGALVFANDIKAAEAAWASFSSGRHLLPETKLKEHVLYLQVDGAMMPTRHKNEKGSTWRENKLGMAFSTDHCFSWTNKWGQKEYNITKREYTAFVEKVEGFKPLMLALALRNGYGRYGKTIILSDGATWIRNMKEELFPKAQQILDFYHLCENVSKFAKNIFGEKDSRHKDWADMICDFLRDSCFNRALSEINKLGKRSLAKSKFDLTQYLKNNEKNLDYASYIKNGFYIGSGAIESANRTVLQRRMKLPGMRWNLDTAQYLLSLIAKEKSGLWESDVVEATYRHYGVEQATQLPWPTGYRP